jgi:hypothetical protein
MKKGQTNGMQPPSDQMFRKWGHAFEEDTEGVTVYRPADFEFQRARERAGIEFQPNGTFVDAVIGAGDAQEKRIGHWHLTGPNKVLVQVEGRPARIMDILKVDQESIQVRWHDINP